MKYINNLFLIIFYFNANFTKEFLFSVIIPIYNCGRYLDESIGSIINQTIGLENIQIILVNDGSLDNTEEICLRYKKKYFKNIIYIKIKHSGVSKARNIGLNYANGTYINFLDSDDKWDSNAFKYILSFFESYKHINYVAGRIKLFEALNIYHPLDYKFYKTRIVNLSQEYNCIQLQASSSVFKRSILKGKYYKEEISFSEDTRLINTILLINPIFGVVKEALYYYRRRNDFSSAIQNKATNLNYYFTSINSVFNYFINSSIFLYGKVLPFIQYLISYELLYRLETPAYKYLDSEKFNKYILMIDEILIQIDDKYILEQTILSNKYKILLLSKKYHADLRYKIKYENKIFKYYNFIMINLNTPNSIFSWKILNIKNNILILEAADNFWLPRENYYYFCKIENKIYFPKYIENTGNNFYTMYGLIEKGRIILFEIPLKFQFRSHILYFYLSYMNINIEIFPFLGIFSHIPNINHGYYISENYIIKYLNKRLILFPNNKTLQIQFENQYCNELQKIKKDYIVKLRKKLIKSINNYNKEKTSEIWIINDGQDRAGGNGEYFFRFLKIKKPKKIKPYFAILKNCSDYKRLKGLGGILDLNSQKFKDIFLESKK